MKDAHAKGGWLCGHSLKLLICVALAASLPAAALDASSIEGGGPGLVTAEARRLVTMPAFPTPPVAPTATLAGEPQEIAAAVTVETFDTGSHRVHVVSMAGKTYRATVPLEGPRQWLAFDPSRRAFAELLPSIRVELGNGVDPKVVAKAVDAVGIEVFDMLGFAIVTLPANLHPAAAEARIEALPGQPEAALRLRRPKIKWR